MSSARDQHGVAVPMAVLSALILSTVVAGFATLSAIEPVVAGNQLRVAQARAIAEAGVERALWALSNPADAQGIPQVFSTAPAPYDGSRLIPVEVGGHIIGGFRVTVRNGAAPYERDISAVGWAPSDTAPHPRALQKISVTAINPRLIVKDPPAALSAGGDLTAGGTLVVDALSDQSCGRKVGTVSLGETRVLPAATSIRGSADGNEVKNQVTDAGGGGMPAAAGDLVTHVSRASLEAFALSPADLNSLRGVARTRGTYLKGPVSFDAVNRMPDGVVFVDAAADGAPESSTVRVDGPASSDATGPWSGWLIVDGSLSLRGDTRMKGFVHAERALGIPTGSAIALSGAAIGRGGAEWSTAGLVAETGGDLSIVYDCNDVRTGGGKVPGRWARKAGTYREVSGS